MGGTGYELSPVMRVTLGDTVDVWAVPQDQWKVQHQSAMQGAFSIMTRYAPVLGATGVQITRHIHVGTPVLNGQTVAFGNEYLEAWTPFSRAAFNAMALHVDGTGKPDWWYRCGYNFERYPNRNVNKTFGYAVFYDENNLSGPAVAVVFGKKQPNKGSYVQNSMEWDTGAAILPGLNLPYPTGGLVVQTLVVLPLQGIDGSLGPKLDGLVGALPAPSLYTPDEVPSDLQELFEALKAQQCEAGSRVEHLAPLVVV